MHVTCLCVCECTQKYSEHLFMKCVYKNKKERDRLDANIKDSFELPIHRDVLLGETAIVIHRAEAKLNIFHKLALKCSMSFP